MAYDPRSDMEVVEHVARQDFKRLLLNTEKGSIAKDVLHKIGLHGYVKVVKNIVKTGKERVPEHWPEEIKSVAEGTSQAAIDAREAYGKKEASAATRSLAVLQVRPRQARTNWFSLCCLDLPPLLQDSCEGPYLVPM